MSNQTNNNDHPKGFVLLDPTNIPLYAVAILVGFVIAFYTGYKPCPNDGDGIMQFVSNLSRIEFEKDGNFFHVVCAK